MTTDFKKIWSSKQWKIKRAEYLDIPESTLILYTRVMLYLIAVCILFTF